MSVVYTVGYEGTDIERFINTLVAAKISQIADVRAVPISRKKGFSKSKLGEHLASAGIEYRHFVRLGDPKPGRDAARAGRFDEFRRIYGEHFSGSEAQEELDELRRFVANGATALLCFERDPRECHRSIVANSLKASVGFEVFNLYADEPQKYVRHANKVPAFQPFAQASV